MRKRKPIWDPYDPKQGYEEVEVESNDEEHSDPFFNDESPESEPEQ